MGVSNHDKAFRVLDDCRSNILSHPKPKNRLREFIVILKDSQPTTKLVAARIEEKVGRTIIATNNSLIVLYRDHKLP